MIMYKGSNVWVENVQGGENVPVSHEGGICIDPRWIAANMDENESRGGMKRSWIMNAWIPIPANLLAKRETRIFLVQASVWVPGRDDEEPERVTGGAEMSVSHLRMCKEMDLKWNWRKS